MLYKNITELIGKTPLMEICSMKREFGLNATILAKLECFNPAGSTKDRAALYMINDAIKKGLLKEGGVIIEPTSGNTGIGLGAICAYMGFSLILTMPSSMSIERQKLLSAYGAKIVLTDAKAGMQGAVEKAKELAKNTPNSFICDQFSNPSNPLAHFETTGEEIYSDTLGEDIIFVAGIGTGGTISGTGRFLKSKNKNIKIVGIEPFSSPLLTKGEWGGHMLQGIGANFVPENVDREVIDEILTIKDEDALFMSRFLAKNEGILAGISSGAALMGAKILAERKENASKTIVALLPDTGERYLSTPLFEEV